MRRGSLVRSLLGILLAVVAAVVDSQGSADGHVYDLIVVGGGLTGLTAAHEIRKRDPKASILVLEARERLGGRVHGVPMKAAHDRNITVDFGGQWIGSSHREILALIAEMGLKTERQAFCGVRSVHVENNGDGRKRKTRGTAEEEEKKGERKNRAIQWGTDLSPSSPWKTLVDSPQARALASLSVEQFLMIGNTSTYDTDALHRLLQTFYDVPETEISALQVLMTAASDRTDVDGLLSSFGHGGALHMPASLLQLIKSLHSLL